MESGVSRRRIVADRVGRWNTPASVSVLTPYTFFCFLFFWVPPSLPLFFNFYFRDRRRDMLTMTGKTIENELT